MCVCVCVCVCVGGRGFPGGSVVKSLSASAGDAGSSPGPGRFHMPWEKLNCASQLLKPMSPRAHGPQQEKPLQ